MSALGNLKGLMSTFDDGSRVIFRPVSSDGSPAITIGFRNHKTSPIKCTSKPIRTDIESKPIETRFEYTRSLAPDRSSRRKA